MAERQQNVKLTGQGRSYTQSGVNISWPYGREASEVAAPPSNGRWPREVQEAVLSGKLAYTDGDATPSNAQGVGVARVLSRKEARERNAQPAGPVVMRVRRKDGTTAEVEAKAPEVPKREPVDYTIEPPLMVEGATEEPAEAEGHDLSELSKGELEMMADELGLPKSGTKADLIERIEEAQEA